VSFVIHGVGRYKSGEHLKNEMDPCHDRPFPNVAQLVFRSQRPMPHDSHIASATAATVHAAVQAMASASQIAAALRFGSGQSSSGGIGSSGRTSPSGGGCTCFISRSPRVGNTRRRRFSQSCARNHADLSRSGLQSKTG